MEWAATLLCVLATLIVLPITALVLAFQSKNKSKVLADKIEGLEKRTLQLLAQIGELKREIGALKEDILCGPAHETVEADSKTGPPETSAAAKIAHEPARVVAGAKPPAPPAPVPASPVPELPVQAGPMPIPPPQEPVFAAPPQPGEAIPQPAPQLPVQAPPPAPPPPAAAPQVAAPGAAKPQPPIPPPPRPPYRPPAPGSPPPPPKGPDRPAESWKFDWESFVGVKLFSWLAGIALVIAAVFFLKLTIDRGWLIPELRMALGILTGVALLIVCELKVARKYAVTANAMDAAGIAILFSTFFASHSLWKLIGAIPTFGLLVLTAAVAVILSIRRESLFIALLGLVGGFATPALLSTGEDRPFGLFGYLLILNAGLAWVGFKKRWPVLSILSLIFTTLYQWGWVAKFLKPEKLPIAVGIFLIFPIFSVLALLAGELKGREGLGWIFERTALFSAGLPLLFALFAASVPAYGKNYWLLFGFLFVLDLGLAVIAAARESEILHAAAGGSTLLVMALWLGNGYSSGAWPSVLWIVSGFVILYLGFSEALFRLGRPWGSLGEIGTYTAPGLLFVFPVFAGIEKAAASPGLIFSVLFVLMGAISLYSVYRQKGPIHFIGAFFVLAAEAVWSANHLSDQTLLSGLAIYAVFAVFYLGVPLIASAFGKDLRPKGSGSVLLLVSLGLLFFLAAGPAAHAALWGLALLLAVMNLGLFIEGARGVHPFLSAVGVVLSWVLIAVWWATSLTAAMIIPALSVVTLFAAIAIAGTLWAGARTRDAKTPGKIAPFFGQGLFLALAGHLFLLFVASQRSLAVPPWPMLAVLALLDLAIGAAALYARRGDLLLAALAASYPVLIVFAVVARAGYWSETAVLFSGAISIFGLLWLWFSRLVGVEKGGKEGNLFAGGAASALFLSQCVVVLATLLPGCPSPMFLSLSHSLLLAATLALAAYTGWNALGIAALLPASAGMLLYQAVRPAGCTFTDELLISCPIYLIYLAYPLLLGERAKKSMEPYLAAVLAGLPFFFAARHSIVLAGWGDAIGILPIVQAGLTSILVWRLLGIEPPGERNLGRLATVSGAVLAFVTAAVPLQLEKQWITIGWALLGAALIWLYGKIPHGGLLWWSASLMAVVFIRLALNRAVLDYHPRQGVAIFNWYLYAYLVCAVAFFLAGWLAHRGGGRLFDGAPGLTAPFYICGTILLFLLLNIEIADFYSKGATLTFNFSAGIGQDMTYTLGWAVFAIGLLAAGVIFENRPTRLASIILLVVTVLKCFLHDTWRLGGLYRVASFVGLAVCLALVALVLQKLVLPAKGEVRR